ncbi:MAG: hypothetical protein K0R98_1685, partial [Rickettsiaceae bacterium]|nr:hypothetical protein [Rickettsiaceae bacterium]
NFDKNTTLRTGSFYSDSDKGKIFGFVNDISHTFEHASLGLQIGMINEEKTFLGSQTERAFALNENTATWFYNLSGNIPLPKKFNLYGSYNYGVSFPDAAAESLFSNISEIQSYSFKVGINKSDSFTKGDKLDFVVSQPLMVSNGNANLNLPVGRDAAGNITRANHNVNLSPTGREIDLGAFYTLNFADNLSSISTGAIYRLEPNHVAEASPDAIAGRGMLPRPHIHFLIERRHEHKEWVTNPFLQSGNNYLTNLAGRGLYPLPIIHAIINSKILHEHRVGGATLDSLGMSYKYKF